jgi:hypothetical protein
VPQKLSAKNKVVRDTEIINENKFHDWRMESLANTTTVDLEIVNENWVATNQEIINENKFHDWHLESSTNTIHCW